MGNLKLKLYGNGSSLPKLKINNSLILNLDASNYNSWQQDPLIGWKSTINNYNVTLSGTFTWDEKSIDFKLGGGRIVKTPQLTFGARDFSVCAIFKVNDSSGSWKGIITSVWNTGALPGTNEWSLGSTHTAASIGKPSIAIQTNNITYTCTATTTIVANIWYYLVGTRKGDTLKIYLNGVLENTIINSNIALPMTNTSNNFYIGGFGGGLTGPNPIYYYNGDIGNIQIYDRALTQEQVQ
jgi:hypothetical protein